jgi:hypothetical protein
MELEHIRKIQEIYYRSELLHIEVICKNPRSELEVRCGYFFGLTEPSEDQMKPPLVTVAYTLDRNWCPKGTKAYPIKDVNSIKLLRPELVPIREIKNNERMEIRYGGGDESSLITVPGYFLNFVDSEIEIARALDEHSVPTEREKYLIEKIFSTRILKPVDLQEILNK